MARLTDEEKINLSRNLQKLTPTKEARQALCYATGIKPRTYQTYYYGEKGASGKALELIADYFNTTPEMLVSKNSIAEKAKQQKELRNYYPIWLDRTTTADQQILEIIRQELGTRGKAGKTLYSFLTMIEAANFGIRVRPDYSDEEITAYHKAISGREDDIIDARESQYELKYFRFAPLPLKDELRQKLEEIGSTPEYQHFISLMDEDTTTVRLTVKQEQFIKRAQDGEYTETSLCDLPLTFIITMDKNKDGLSSEQIREEYLKAEYLEDFYYMIAEVPIADMLDIQKKFLHEPFKVGDTFLDFIDNELEPYKIRKAGA